MNERIRRDNRYMTLVYDILENDEFLKVKDIRHHGDNRFDHSVRVSYYSYKFSKLLGLDAREVARAGLLHDFFFEVDKKQKFAKRMVLWKTHPEVALKNANSHFKLTEKEKDIIVSHMFPVSLRAPRYLESWIVDVTDDVVAICEASMHAKKHLGKAFSYLCFFFVSFWR